MSLSREAKIGILVSVTTITFFIGFYFLKGTSLFSHDRVFYCTYSDVQGMQPSANVQVRGLNVGRVAHMELLDNKGVRVTLSVYKSVEIPAGTIAKLESPGLLSSPIITLELGSGPEMLSGGSELPAVTANGLASGVSEELTPRLKELKVTITTLDSALEGINAMVGPQNQAAIGAAIKSIQTTSDNLASLSGALSKEGGEISSVIHNANSITGNLAKNNESVQQILTNTNNLSRQLANAPIEKTMNQLQSTINQLNDVAGKINSGQGSLGKLVNDKELYNNLNSSLQTLNALMADLKAHPSHYVNVNIFGKKKS